MGTENIKLGACDVVYDSVDIGLTKGGVTLEVSTETYKVTVDQFGETSVSESIIARNVTVTVPLVETSLDNLVATMPGAVKIGSDPYRVDVASGVGINLYDIAKNLLLHPRSEGASTAFDINIPLASTSGNLSFNFGPNEERIFSLTFQGYINTTNDHLFSMGDLTAS